MPVFSSLGKADGLTHSLGRFDPKETVDRLVNEIHSRDLQIFAGIDHAAGAAEVGLELRPTEVIIFGNARGGTPLMQQAQTAGIDLPLKILVWQDAQDQTWICYNDPAWIAQRHGLSQSEAIISKFAALLSDISKEVVQVS